MDGIIKYIAWSVQGEIKILNMKLCFFGNKLFQCWPLNYKPITLRIVRPKRNNNDDQYNKTYTKCCKILPDRDKCCTLAKLSINTTFVFVIRNN